MKGWYGENTGISTQILEFDNVLTGEHPTLQIIKVEDGSIWMSAK